MAGLGEFFSNLISGNPGNPGTTTLPPAPPLASYPTPEDALEARKYDFGYGTGNEPYTQGNVARVLGSKNSKGVFEPESGGGVPVRNLTATVDDPAYSQNLDLKTPATYPIHDTLGTQLAQAALAANRSPVANLGFDPSRAVMDVEIEHPTIAGVYTPKRDAMYAAASEPSAIVHESAHRGIKQLKEDPALADLFNRLPDEELLVRYIMATQAGDPEKTGGPKDQQQRETALNLMKHYGTSFERLNRAAEDAYAARRPGGPR